jgi:hypothetical protein
MDFKSEITSTVTGKEKSAKRILPLSHEHPSLLGRGRRTQFSTRSRSATRREAHTLCAQRAERLQSGPRQ